MEALEWIQGKTKGLLWGKVRRLNILLLKAEKDKDDLECSSKHTQRYSLEMWWVFLLFIEDEVQELAKIRKEWCFIARFSKEYCYHWNGFPNVVIEFSLRRYCLTDHLWIHYLFMFYIFKKHLKMCAQHCVRYYGGRMKDEWGTAFVSKDFIV